jgi:hypothetical protein
MVDGAGSLMAVSVTFPTKRAAVAGVEQAREIAGTGLIRDRSTDSTPAVIGAPPRSTRRVPDGAKRSSSLIGTSLISTSLISSGPGGAGLVSGPGSNGPGSNGPGSNGPGSALSAAGRKAHAHH